MANDIYFGNGRKTPAPGSDPKNEPARAPIRQPVTREPLNDSGASWSRQDPGEDGMIEQMRSLGASGGAARPKVVRDPQPGKAYLERRAGRQPTGGAPASGFGRTIPGAAGETPPAPRRETVPGRDPRAGRPVAYRPPERTAAEERYITEQIDSELLYRAPTQIPFNYIDTDDGENGGRSGKHVSEKKKQKIKRKKMKAAQKSAKKAAKRKKKSGFRRFVKAVLCLVLILALLTGGAAAYVVTGYRPQPLASNAYTESAALLSHPAVYNLLVMGIDMESSSGTSRSDSMILLSVDNAHMKLKMTSFLRDSYVYIPDHGYAKLNAACTYGGAQLVCDTIEYNFGIHIDGCVKVGYEILMGLVDGVGGITIPEVDATEAAALAAEAAALGREDVEIPMGTSVKMNGFQTMLYCRIRKGQDDFYRTERQREVLGVLIKKALLTNPVKLAMLGRRLIAKAQCSLPRAELFALAFRAAPCLLGGTAAARIPQDGTWYDDMRNSQAVLVVNFEENTAFLRDFIYGN